MFSKYRILKSIAMAYRAQILATHWNNSDYLVVPTQCFAALTIYPNVPPNYKSLDHPAYEEHWRFVRTALMADYEHRATVPICDFVSLYHDVVFRYDQTIYCATWWPVARHIAAVRSCKRDVYVYASPVSLLLQFELTAQKTLLLLVKPVNVVDLPQGKVGNSDVVWYERVRPARLKFRKNDRADKVLARRVTVMPEVVME